MSTQESKRLDLYNGLQEVLGKDRAKTLMTYLPAIESKDLLTKSHFDGRLGQIETRMGQIETRMGQIDSRLDRVERGLERFDMRFAELGKRIDRVLIAVVGALFVILAGIVTSAALV